MRPLGLITAATAFLLAAATIPTDAAGRFDQRLAKDKEAIHLLNRLTFGPRAGDVDEVRRLGAERWIRQQLAPDQVAENPVLAAKLKPLVSLRLATWEIFETFQPPTPLRVPAPPALPSLLPQADVQKLLTGATDQRRALLDSLTPDVRQQVLAVVPPAVLDALPDLKPQAERARQIQDEIRTRQLQEQQRKLRPPLNELLTPEQARDVQRGTAEEKMAVLTALDAEKRAMVLRVLPPQTAQTLPDPYRRQAQLLMNPQQGVANELIEAKLLQALYSNRQLQEVLVDFWLNHFNVFIGKGQVRMLITSYERDAIRPHVLGRFRDLLLATARHPAMLFYLDNYQSRTAPDNAPQGLVIAAGAPRQGLNENYAREVMELHTLGVDGGYTQADVINVARAFTGWTIFDPGRYGEFQFNPVMHDRGEKVVLGTTIPRGGGESDGLTVIDLLARHPSTARFISRKLAQRFVADDPPQDLVDRMADTFRKTDGDLRAVMETLLLSREFLSEGAWRAKMKSPLEMVVSSLRALDAEVTDTTALAQRIADLGQPLYGKAEPTGYSNTAESWTSSAALLGRINFAGALAAGQIAGVKVDTRGLSAVDPARAAARVFGIEPPPETLAVIEKSLEGKTPATATLATVLLASPDFQKR